MHIEIGKMHTKLYLSYFDGFSQICIGQEVVNYSN